MENRSLCGDHFICGDAKGAVTMYDVRNLKIVNQINGTSFVSGVSCMAKGLCLVYSTHY